MVARELACKNRLLALLPDEVFARWWPELEEGSFAGGGGILR